MKFFVFIILFCYSHSSFLQGSAPVKSVIVEFANWKSGSKDFIFSSRKDFDRSGNLITYTKSTQFDADLSHKVSYSYDSLNRVISIQTFSPRSKGDIPQRITRYKYAQDSIIRYTRSSHFLDSIPDTKIIITKYDEHGNIRSIKNRYRNRNTTFYSTGRTEYH